jgi:CBS domain-containing protein
MAKPAEPAEHQSLFKQLKLKDLVPAKSREVITLDKDATVETAMGVLRDHNILSVPLIDKKQDNKIAGVLSISDLCTAIAFQACFEKFKLEPQKVAEIKKPEFEALVKTSLFSTPAGSFLGVSEEGKRIWEYDEDTPAETILEIFSKGVHRVIVKTKGGRRIVSQTDVAKYLKDHEGKLGDFVKRPINELGLVQDGKGIIKLSMYSSALEGFQKLYNLGWEISALPIVDKTGDIVATLSTSDMRGLTPATFPLLLAPVLDFLGEVAGGARPSITARPTSTLEEVIRKVVFARVHRVWIIDNNKITGVVSLTDIICKFSPFDFKKPEPES